MELTKFSKKIYYNENRAEYLYIRDFLVKPISITVNKVKTVNTDIFAYEKDGSFQLKYSLATFYEVTVPENLKNMLLSQDPESRYLGIKLLQNYDKGLI